MPHFPALSLEKILDHFPPPHSIYEFLPDEVNEFVVNRQFVLDVGYQTLSHLKVINTIDGDRLKAFVQKAIHDRKIKITTSAKNSIEILPVFKAAILKSNQVSGKTVDN